MDVQGISRLGSFDYLTDKEMLRGTPFWGKRDTITREQLQKKPAYRVMKIASRMAKEHKLKEFNDFLVWLESPIDNKELQYPFVRRFRKSYGYFNAPRFLLTFKNAVDMYIDEHRDE